MTDAGHIQSATLDSPVGRITVRSENGEITRLSWTPDAALAGPERSNLMSETVSQLNAYFSGSLTKFDLPLAPAGTNFQKSVWNEMLKIPIGRTRTYGEVALTLGSAARAVGNACGANPVPIIIPCHRILAGNGMGGFSGAGGVATKQTLLDLEGYQPAQARLI